MPERFKDVPVIIGGASLLVLIMIYTGKEKIHFYKLATAWVGSILASVLMIGIVEYFFPDAYNGPLHDFLVSLFTLFAFQVLVLAYKRKLLKKIYDKKEKEFLKK